MAFSVEMTEYIGEALSHFIFGSKFITKLYACSYNVYKSNQLSVMALYFIIYENMIFLRETGCYAHAYKNS